MFCFLVVVVVLNARRAEIIGGPVKIQSEPRVLVFFSFVLFVCQSSRRNNYNMLELDAGWEQVTQR